MIPKIIHYCWFGKGLMPRSQKDCIKEWKRLMPNYTIMRWDESNFDPELCLYTSVAYKQKKYAFVSDVCRLQALSRLGGIYLDTDVELFQPLDTFLNCNFFSGVELYRDFFDENVAKQYLLPDGSPKSPNTDIPHFELLTSTMGSCPDNPVINSMLHSYLSLEGLDHNANLRQYVIFDRLLPRTLVPYGFRYIDQTQHLDNDMVVYATGTFGYRFSTNPKHTVSYHHNATTWDHSKWSKFARLRYFLDQMGLKKMWHRPMKQS